MSMKDDLKKINEAYDEMFKTNGRYTVVKGKYLLDRSLFLLFSAVFVLLVIVSVYQFYNTPNHYYASCPVDAYRCVNPFFEHCEGELEEVCNLEFINSGESIGSKPPYVVSNLGDLTLYLFLVYALVNHLLNNRGGKIGRI